MSKVDELAEAIAGLESELEELRAENFVLKGENKELWARINMLIKIMEGAV